MIQTLGEKGYFAFIIHIGPETCGGRRDGSSGQEWDGSRMNPSGRRTGTETADISIIPLSLRTL